MDERTIELPAMVRAKAANLGEDGDRWVADLPEVIAELEQRWSIAVGAAIQNATEAFVAKARTADGRDAVLKLTLPMAWRAVQHTAIERADGRGYVRLLNSDRDRDAMLMEALGPSLGDLDWSPERVIATLSATLRQAWELPLVPGLKDGRQKALELAEFIGRLWRDLDRPCPVAVIDQARRFADNRAAAHRPDRSVFLHGDPHADNALRVFDDRPGTESGFVFVDPDGFAAEPAYDLGVILAGWDNRYASSGYLLGGDDAHAVAQWLCELLAKSARADAQADAQAVWEWGFLVRVATGVFALEHGAAWGQDKLDTAARLL